MHNTLIIQFDIGVVLLIRKGLVLTISSIYPKIFFILYHLYWDSITSMPSEIFTTNPTQGPRLVSGTLHFLGEYLINTNIFLWKLPSTSPELHIPGTLHNKFKRRYHKKIPRPDTSCTPMEPPDHTLMATLGLNKYVIIQEYLPVYPLPQGSVYYPIKNYVWQIKTKVRNP